MDISEIRNKCNDESIEMTQHVLVRFQQRRISYAEVKEIVLSGEIIEDYPDDYPYPSCLMFGKTAAGRVLHVVVGLSETSLWIVTAYEPSPAKWSEDFRHRKE